MSIIYINPYRFAAAGPTDPDFANVSLLLHGDGTNGSTTIIDSSPSPKTITAFGNAQISTAQSKFGGASLSFNVGYYTTSYSSGLYRWWDTPYTVEAWVYASSFASTDSLFRPLMVGNMSPSGLTNYWSFGVTKDARVYFYFFNGASNSLFSATNVVPLNSWTHIAMTHESGTVRLFANGIVVSTSTDVGTPQDSGSHPLSIGAYNGAQMNNIHIDDLRITKGVARYTSNFTPPAAPFPDA